MINRVVGTAKRNKEEPLNSVVMYDFNNKKQKILSTLKNVDDLRCGMVRLQVFANLLECLEVDVDIADMNSLKRRFGLEYQGDTYIKYESVLKSLRFDNHSERWVAIKVNDDDPLFMGRRTTNNLRASIDSRTNHKVLSHVNL